MPGNPNQDEALLLRSVANGDRKAFTSLYSQYLDHVYKFVFLFVKSEAVTEEIVQDVFMRIWKYRARLSQLQSFRPYLLRAAKNRIIDHVRFRQVEERTLAAYRVERKSFPETPGDAFDYKAYYLLVQKAIAGLSPRYRRKISYQISIYRHHTLL